MRKNLLLLPLLFLLYACTQKSTLKLVEREGVQIAYSRYGAGDTTLLFVHGWCINKEYWQPQVDFFSPRYTVVAIDLPGFGQSGKIDNNWSFSDYTEDVKAVIEQLKLKNVIVIGHSMSGDILLDISNKYPQLITGIVGVDNLHEPAGKMSELDSAGATAFFSLFSSRFDSVVTASMGQYLFQPSTSITVRERVMKDIYAADSLIAVGVIKSLTFFAQEEKIRMQKLNHKLYLVNSDVMPVKIDSLNKYCIKGVKVSYVHNTGHYPMIEKPGEFNAVLKSIIDQF